MKRYITARSVLDGNHYFIDCSNPLEAFKTAQKLHQFGEHRYIQIRFRSSKPPLKKYIQIKDLGLIGA